MGWDIRGGEGGGRELTCEKGPGSATDSVSVTNLHDEHVPGHRRRQQYVTVIFLGPELLH